MANLSPITVANNTPVGRRVNAALAQLRAGRAEAVAAGSELFAVAVNLGYNPADPASMTDDIKSAIAAYAGVQAARVPDLLDAFVQAQEVSLLPLLARFTNPVG